MKHLLFTFLAAWVITAQAATLTIGTATVQNMAITTLTNGVGGSTPPVEPEGLTNNLVSYWAMDEESYGWSAMPRVDSVGDADLTEGGTAYLSGVTGVIGRGAEFQTGNREILYRDDGTDVNFGDADWTLAGWVKASSWTLGAFNSYFLTKCSSGTAGTNEFYLCYATASSKFAFTVYSDGTSGTSVTADTLGTPSTGTWYHIAIWHDAGNNEIGIRVNGGTADTASHSGGVYEGTLPFIFGGIYGSVLGSQYLEGVMDEWGYWQRVLSQADCQALYNSGNGLNPLD